MMIRKDDNLNEQKYCYGNHHCPLTSASIIPLVLFLAVLTPLMLQGGISTTQSKEREWVHGGCVAGRCKCVVTVRWLCPKKRLSVWGKGEDGSFWPRCFSPSLGGQKHFLACTDSAPGTCPRSYPEEEASPEISAGVDAVWSGSPCRGCVSSQSALAWWCPHISMASGASEGQSQCIK